jgi:hypothetical protein
MKKIALAAFSATAMLALSACGDDAADETDVFIEETTIEPAPVEPIVDEPTMVEDGDTMADDTMVDEVPAE